MRFLSAVIGGFCWCIDGRTYGLVPSNVRRDGDAVEPTRGEWARSEVVRYREMAQSQRSPMSALLQELPDQEVPDHEVPDHEVPDHDVPFQNWLLQLVPDHDVPDHDVPDHEVPDQLVPDHDVPDQLVPDHDVPFHSPELHDVPVRKACTHSSAFQS